MTQVTSNIFLNLHTFLVMDPLNNASIFTSMQRQSTGRPQDYRKGRKVEKGGI